MDNRVLIGIAVVALLGLGFIGYRAMNPAQPDVPDTGGETPDTGGETPDTGGETPDTGGETPDTGGETITATVSGTINDDSGNPIEGVLVQISDVSTTTDSNGEYSVEVSNGTYYVEAGKDTYSKGIKSITVTEETEYEADFTLRVLSTGTGDGKTIRVITRHGADIMLVSEELFLASDYAVENNIVNIEWLPIADSLWIETISRSGDVDVAWGGGPDLFDIILDAGLLAPLEGENIDAILAEIPEDIGGSETRRYVGDDVYWAGAAISSFGFTINTQLIDYYGLPEPATWEDLASTTYAAYLPTTLVGTADATKSTSNTRMFQIILQIYGWRDGWDLLIRMGANSKIFDQSGNVRDAVINREIAVGTTIDFYGYTAQWLNPEFCKYIFPSDGTIVNADPIALLTTSQYPEEAQGFIEWVISAEGQKVWLDSNINRLPVNDAVFDTPEGQQRADLEDVFIKTQEALTIEFDSEEGASYYSAIRSYYRAVIVNPQIQLEKVWEDLTWALEDGQITQEQFDDLAFRLGDPDEFEFIDPATGETEIFTMEYAQSINSQIEVDVEYKTQMVDAWADAALDHYEEIAAELSSIT
ncbi:extracellular solute-binding protein [Candidatus Bathyarchaeota archaeon]|nr:extracellular solute-binding protein [Candidatus Bathyarchaeota archaeon]